MEGNDKCLEFLKSYQDVSRALSSTLESKELFGILLQNMAETMKVKASSLLLIEESSNELKHVHSYGLSQNYLSKGPLDLDKSLLDRATGNITLITDAQKDERVKYKEETLSEGIVSIVFVPIKVKDKVAGAIQLYTGAPCAFSDDELKFVSSLAELGGLALENARLYEQRKENNRLFWGLAKSINSSTGLNETLESIAKGITKAMGLKGCVIRVFDEKRKVLELMASYGLSEKYLKKGKVDLNKSHIEPVEGKPAYIYDASSDEKMQYPQEAREEGIASILSVPMSSKDKMIGVLRLYTYNPRKFDEDETTFICTLADFCGIAIENALMYQKIKDDFDELRDNLWSYRSWF